MGGEEESLNGIGRTDTAIMGRKCVWYQSSKVIPTSETTDFHQTPLQKGSAAHLRGSSGCIELVATYVELHS